MDELGQFEKVKVENIQPNDYNPNIMTDKEKQRLSESLDRFGDIQTVLLYKDNEGNYTVIDGEHRIKSLSEGSEIKSITLNDDDMEQIKERLQTKGIKVNTTQDVLKQLTVNMNRLRGSASPVKLGELIDSIDMENQEKAMLFQMDEQEMQFYSMVQEVEEEKQRIQEKNTENDEANEKTLKFKVKSADGLKSLILDFDNKLAYYDGEYVQLEGVSFNVNPNFQSSLRLRYKPLLQSEETNEQENSDET